MVLQVKSMEGFQAALTHAGDKLVVVDFTATWCGPCQRISPVFENLSKEYKDVVFLKVDVDDAADVSSQCGIHCMPTFQFYKNGKKVGEFSGADTKKLEETLQRLK